MNQISERYTIENNIIKFDDCKLEFLFPIYQSLEIKDVLIVILDVLAKATYNQNVFGINIVEKTVVWQIEKRRFREKRCPFVGMGYEKNELWVNNWCSFAFLVDPLTGQILKEEEIR